MSADTIGDAEAPPTRGKMHDALAMFLGDWKAEGQSYGSPDQDPRSPKAKPEPWISTHTGRWHTGEFFLIQDERAHVGDTVFDTISIMGVDPETGTYFAHGFENHGFERRYEVGVDGNVWTFSGKTEHARIEFSQDGHTQTIAWEWKPADRWLPLCDRVARRVVSGQARA